jgi:uncharacterized SAM-binding protein YcdF (DUF218 family)
MARMAVERPARRWRFAKIAAVVLACAALLLAVQRVTVLTWLGSLLVVEDPLLRADAIVTLAGGNFDREIEAADLYRAGYAPRVVLTLEPELPTATYLSQRGIHLMTAEEERLHVIGALGVPRDRVVLVKGTVSSTFDEARAVGAWAAQSGARRLIIVSSPQHTARAKFIFQRYMGNPAISLVMRPSKVNDFRADNWWTKRAMLREGIFELQKLVAYRLWY